MDHIILRVCLVLQFFCNHMNFCLFNNLILQSMHPESRFLFYYADLLVFAEGNVAPFWFKFELDFLSGELLVNIGNEVDFVFKGSFISLIQVTKKLKNVQNELKKKRLEHYLTL